MAAAPSTSPRAKFGRGLILATAAGMIVAGSTILIVGMTTVFVPDDLSFMNLSVPELHDVNARLVSLIAHPPNTPARMLEIHLDAATETLHGRHGSLVHNMH